MRGGDGGRRGGGGRSLNSAASASAQKQSSEVAQCSCWEMLAAVQSSGAPSAGLEDKHSCKVETHFYFLRALQSRQKLLLDRIINLRNRSVNSTIHEFVNWSSLLLILAQVHLSFSSVNCLKEEVCSFGFLLGTGRGKRVK